MMNKCSSKYCHKSLLTNIASVVLSIVGIILSRYSTCGIIVKNIGIFALSGAITNWLAVHMLFEKIPFLYGSGTIQIQFIKFKQSIKKLIMKQFFNNNNVKIFLASSTKLIIGNLSQKIDYEYIYAELTKAINKSSYSSLISLLGGNKILQQLKEPIITKLKELILELGSEKYFDSNISTALFQERIEILIDHRLEQLTSIMVKNMVEDIIKEHLGWLVVWGGCFGGVIGVIFYFI